MELRADVPTVAAALAASLVASDGVIESAEKKVASVLGARMLPGFSPLTFETLLDGITELPAAYELACQLRELIDEEGKAKIMEYLVAIATADDRVVDDVLPAARTLPDLASCEQPSRTRAPLPGSPTSRLARFSRRPLSRLSITRTRSPR